MKNILFLVVNFGDMVESCDVVEPRSIPSIIHHFQRFFTHMYCGLLFCFVQLQRNDDCPYFYKWCNLICYYNLRLNFHTLLHFFKNFEPRVCYENGLTRVQDHCRKMCGNCLIWTFILPTKWHVFFNVQENKRFKVVNLFGFCVCEDGKQLLYHYIRHFFSFMRKIS